MDQTPSLADLRQAFLEFADTTGTRAPLWSAVGRRLGTDPGAEPILDLLLAAPPEQRRPVLLMAAIHDVALRGDEPLAAHFAHRRGEGMPPPTSDPWVLVQDLVRRRGEELAGIVATHHTQTNEVGRCAVIMPVLAMVEQEMGPLGLVEFGASAGLLLNLDRYRYRYEHGGDTVLVHPATPSAHSLELTCGLRGDVRLPRRSPTVVSRVGVDPQPIDVNDEEATRWLEACIWPDQTDRIMQLRTALDIARDSPVQVIRDDGITRAPRDMAATAGHPVLVSSWALTYAATERRVEMLQRLDALAASRDLTMVLFEDPALIDGIPVPRRPDDRGRTVVAMVRWRSGRRDVARLGTAHPHGFWWHLDG